MVEKARFSILGESHDHAHLFSEPLDLSVTDLKDGEGVLLQLHKKYELL
jgi:hypothetical protein